MRTVNKLNLKVAEAHLWIFIFQTYCLNLIIFIILIIMVITTVITFIIVIIITNVIK